MIEGEEKMFCTNCGAEVSPDQKFCNKCGAPVMAGAVNVGAASDPETTASGTIGNVDNAAPTGSTTVNTDNAVPFQPVYNTQPVAPKKNKVWPVVLIVIAVLLMISIGVGVAIAKAYSYFKNTIETYSEEVEDFDDIEGMDELEDIEEFFEDNYEDEDYDFGFDDDTEYEEYEYAYATYFDDYVYIAGAGVIDDNTAVYNESDKTIGEFCDYIDESVLEDGRTIDRDLLYELLEVHLVDSSLNGGPDYFEQSMMYCLTFANEFSDLDMDVDYCMYSTEVPTTYYYGVEVDGEEDTWTVDYSQKYVYMNEGDTEYTSAGDYGMFSDNTLSLWLYAIDDFFGIK